MTDRVRPVLSMDAPLGGNDLLVDRHELDGETVKAGAGFRRQTGIFRIGDHGEQRLDMRQADPGDNPKLGHMAADRVHQQSRRQPGGLRDERRRQRPDEPDQ